MYTRVVAYDKLGITWCCIYYSWETTYVQCIPLFSSKSPKATNQNKPTKQARQWAGEGSVKEATQLNYSAADGNEESLVVSNNDRVIR